MFIDNLVLQEIFFEKFRQIAIFHCDTHYARKRKANAIKRKQEWTHPSRICPFLFFIIRYALCVYARMYA